MNTPNPRKAFETSMVADPLTAPLYSLEDLMADLTESVTKPGRWDEFNGAINAVTGLNKRIQGAKCSSQQDQQRLQTKLGILDKANGRMEEKREVRKAALTAALEVAEATKHDIDSYSEVLADLQRELEGASKQYLQSELDYSAQKQALAENRLNALKLKAKCLATETIATTTDDGSCKLATFGRMSSVMTMPPETTDEELLTVMKQLGGPAEEEEDKENATLIDEGDSMTEGSLNTSTRSRMNTCARPAQLQFDTTAGESMDYTDDST